MDEFLEIFANGPVLGVAALVFAAVMAIGGAVVTYVNAQRRRLTSRLQGQQLSEGTQAESSSRSFFEFLARLGSKLGARNVTQDTYTRVMRAGFQSRNAVAVFLATKFLVTVATALILALVTVVLQAPFELGLLIVAVGATFAFMAPNFCIDAYAKKRSQEVRMHLPDMVDLLEICVSGGVGLDQSWNAVSREIRQLSPVLADEMALTALEMQLGEDRGTAMRRMAHRTNVSDLDSLVSALVQSQRFGTSVGQALRVFADDLRELRSTRAEESAETMSVKMMFPMLLFIFPVVFIVAVGPAVLSLIETFAEIN